MERVVPPGPARFRTVRHREAGTHGLRLISVIVQKASAIYGTGMASAVFRLLALVALVIMPLGMSSAPALAGAVDHAAAPAGHCDEQPVQDEAPQSKMDCTAMCTAIPAADVPTSAPALQPKAPRTMAISAPFSGVEPEIATPPPRRA